MKQKAPKAHPYWDMRPQLVTYSHVHGRSKYAPHQGEQEKARRLSR